MSVERYFHWTCDFCGRTVLKRDYGSPSKWRVYLRSFTNDNIKHKCEKCLKTENGESHE